MMTSKVTIRLLGEQDLDSYADLMNCSGIAKWLPHQLPYTSHQVADYWVDLQTRLDLKTLVVEYEGEWAGVIKIGPVGRNPHAHQFGYYLKPEMHGKGIMTEAVNMFVEDALSEGVIRLQTLIHPENTPSRRLMEKCGFTLEGILRSFMVFQEKLIDVCMYAKIKH